MFFSILIWTQPLVALTGTMYLWKKLTLAALSSPLPTAYSQHVVDLSGDHWTVSNKALNVSAPGHLPSQVHLDLYAANVIEDPYYGLNDFNLRWIANNNWTYTSEPIPGLSSTAESSWLVFNGLDTFTTIEFCGQFIGTTENQFRQYTFDISNVLSKCQGNPVLSLNFGSAPKIADAIANDPNSESKPKLDLLSWHDLTIRLHSLAIWASDGL